MKCRSLWHSPAKAVRSNTSRAFGFVSSTSSIVNGWFAACRTAALIGSLLEVEAQAGLGPIHCGELAGAGQRDVGGFHVAPAKADISRIDVGHFDLPHDIAIGRNDRDVTGDHGRDGNIAGGLDGEAVKARETARCAARPAR